MTIKIDPSERWIFFAKTGGGKTELVKYFLRLISVKMPIVIVDPNELWLGKGKGGNRKEWAQGREPGTVDKPHRIDKFHPDYHVQLLQPDVDGTEEDDRLPRLCYDVLKKGDRFIYFDESEGIATATHVPQYIRRLWKTGRAHNIGAWVSTQAPKGIPRIFKSQAEHFVTLKVGEEDIDFVSELVHATDEEVRQLGRYEWLYYNTDMEHAEWHPPIPLNKK